MPKWEYVRLATNFIDDRRHDYVEKVEYLDDERVRDWESGPTLSAFLSQWGEDGWELVAAMESAHGRHTLYLKRPKR